MTAGVTASRRGAVALGDGRHLHFRTYGDARGAPVVALHGTPGSHLKYAPAAGLAEARGLRLIAVDRWGYGDSAAPPVPTLSGYGADIARLADGLGLDRFAVMGLSGGGPYAAATAAVLGERLTGVALVAPVGPIVGADGAAVRLDAGHRFCFLGAGRSPSLIRYAFAGFNVLARRAPRLALRIAMARGNAADKALLRNADFSRHLAHMFADGLRNGPSGGEIDMTLFSRPWDVDLGQTTAPTRIWFGTEDRTVPPAAVEALAMALPRAARVSVAGQGHYWIFRGLADILSWLAAPRW